MEDVTDAAFRRLIASYGKPHVTFTEFTSADGLVRAPESGKRAILKKLLYSEAERPVVAQLFSAMPERMEQAATLCRTLGFDGIDINMGCPDRSVEKSGCGAALIRNPAKARALICAAHKIGLPVSVKTRIGYNADEIDTWLPEIFSEKPAALTVHLRTRKEMSDVPAHWEHMPRILALRDQISPQTRIVGNGDVQGLDDARTKAEKFGCDGVMLGRAIYGNPWLYRDLHDGHRKSIISPGEKIDALIEHIRLFDKLLGDTANFATMKKHFKAYISGWDGAKELRVKLMATTNAKESIDLLRV